MNAFSLLQSQKNPPMPGCATCRNEARWRRNNYGSIVNRPTEYYCNQCRQRMVGAKQAYREEFTRLRDGFLSNITDF